MDRGGGRRCRLGRPVLGHRAIDAEGAVADLLGIGAIRIDIVGQLPETEPLPADLGRPTTLDEAASLTPFTIGVPDGEAPDAVFIEEGEPVIVTVRYGEATAPRLVITHIGGTDGATPDQVARPSIGRPGTRSRG